MSRKRRPVLLPVTALLLIACGGHKQAAPGEVPVEPMGLAFEVENQSSVDLGIYLIVDNVSERLGTVTTNAVLTVEKSWQRVGGGRRLRLRAEVIGSGTRLVTDDLRAQPGQLVRWTLTPDLKMSYWGIY
jgi:hypothetical protein